MPRRTGPDPPKPMEIFAPPQAEAFHGFRSEVERQWFRRNFADRPVLKERSLDVSILSDEVEAVIVTRQWAQYLLIESDCNISWVREFYASLIPGEHGTLHAYVRGRGFSFDVAWLATFMGVPLLPDAPVPWAADARPSDDDVYRILTGNPAAVFVGPNVEQGECTEFFRELNIMLRHTILLTSHKSKFGTLHASYLAAIGNPGTVVSFPRLVMEAMRRAAASKSQRVALPFGSLVSRIITAETNLRGRPTDSYIAIQRQLTHASLSKSVSALASSKRARGESAPSAPRQARQAAAASSASEGEEGGEPRDWEEMHERLDEIHALQESAGQRIEDIYGRQRDFTGRLERVENNLNRFQFAYQRDFGQVMSTQRHLFERLAPGVPFPDTFYDPYSQQRPGGSGTGPSGHGGQ